ncbi:MAG: DUF3854 domain-containing protein [Chloroflexota bacterium]|nr:DUF3854 domain-containing protein [Chloroflexota bacterium]
MSRPTAPIFGQIPEYPRFRTHGAFTRHSRREPCPVCGKPDWCRSFADGWTECMRVEGGKPTRNGGWLHWTGDGAPPGEDWRDHLGADRPRLRVAPAPLPPDPKAEPDVRDLVYRRLIALCGLSEVHHAALRGRGMTEAQITGRAYATLPATGRKALAEQLLAEFGAATMERIPGFYYRRDNMGRRYPMLAGTAGLLVPVRDDEGRIAAFQIRRDTVIEGTPRYLWFSSKDKDGGTGSGAPVHVARPLGGAGSVRAVVITEGPLKADIAADVLGCVVLAAPGVNNWSGVLAILAGLGATEAIIAYDRDAETKPHVMRARDALAGGLAAARYAPQIATWDDAYKGLDDALLADLDPTIRPYPLPRRAGQLEPIPAAAVPPRPLRRLRTLDEARAEHARLYRALVTEHAPGQTVVASPTGAGKTDTAARELCALHAAGNWPMVAKRVKHGAAKGIAVGTRPLRVCYLAQTKEQVEAFKDMTGGLAMVVEGRNPDHTHDWGCHRPETISLVGDARQNPAIDVCQPCKAEYEAISGRGWSCGYLTMKQIAEERKLIAAPIASYFNGSTEIKQFDIIIVDEAIVPHLTETVVLTPAHLRDWLARMQQVATEPRLEGVPRRYDLDDPFRRLVSALDLLLAHAGEIGQEWQPAMPLLRELCPDLPALVARLDTLEPNNTTRRYAFETPRLEGPDKLVPLRLCRDLIDALVREIDRPADADTRLWLTDQGLRLFVVREHLVQILRNRTLINLDATPDPTLRLLFPDLREVRVDVPTPTHVTQITDLLATRTQLAGDDNSARDRVAAALEHVTRDATAPVVFTFKGLDPNVEGEGARLTISNPAAQYGHFDKETRALNRFQDADVLAIAGRYSAPLNELRVQVQGLRFAATPASRAGPDLRLLPYQWRGPDGAGLGRWTHADPDADVDAQVRWSEAATITQAIGRGRAALRSEVAPLRVYLFTSLPIAGLPVDRLTTLDDLGAPPPQRQTPPAFYERRDERNAAAGADSWIRVKGALAALREAGATVTFAAVSARSGVRRQTLYEDPTLRALIEQARTGSNHRVTSSVPPSTLNDRYVCDQGGTLKVTDLEPAQAVLATADHATSRPERQRANRELSDRLAALARERGRAPVPKPSDRRNIAQQEATA